MIGKLYLIPTTLGDNDPMEVLPISVKNTIDSLDYFVVENEKTARRFIKKISPNKSQPNLKIQLIDKHVDPALVNTYLEVCKQGFSVGVLSEAGVPAIADPGAEVVKLAHQKGIQVVPLVGPSSILMAMMASGMNGQSFTFNGYLPIDKDIRKKELKRLEKLSKDHKQSQIFIETPYRNLKMFDDLVATLLPNTQLCIAANITLPSEYIKTLSVKDWKHQKPEIHKIPTIFIIHASL